MTLLVWTAQALQDASRPIPLPISDAIKRIIPVVRHLRHTDGALARFHGGGRGVEGRVDQALAMAGLRAVPEPEPHMGFARLAGGRSSVIVDAAAPPVGPTSWNAHASTLGFELTSGRRPVIVNCGSGARFGEEWRRASRATPSHSTLGLEGVSSSHLGAAGRDGQEQMVEIPQTVFCHRSDTAMGYKLEMSHDGYRTSHGLTHARNLELSVDGRMLQAIDVLAALDDPDQQRFDAVARKQERPGVAYQIRFHLHPDVETAIDGAKRTVGLTLKSGEVWRFEHDGTARLSIAPSVYLENGRLKPRQAQQMVLSGRAMSYATRVRWSLAKTDGTPLAVRDLA